MNPYSNPFKTKTTEMNDSAKEGKESLTEPQTMLKIKIKKTNPDAVLPKYAHHGDAGMDLTAVGYTLDGFGNIVYHTGLAFEIPYGYVGLLFPRSSNSKKELMLTNHVGVIDSGYRGEVTFKYKDLHLGVSDEAQYNVGDRIGQIIIMPYPHVKFEEVDELSETVRGNGGYGSTGK